MTCDELDNLRGRRTLPDGAREHLRDCVACRSLQELWDTESRSAEIPAETLADVHGIVAGLQPVSPLASNRILVLQILLLAAIGVAGGALALGFQGWRALAPWQAAISFSLLVAGVVLMARVVTLQMAPGSLQPLSPGAAIFGIGGGLVTGVIFLFSYTRDVEFVPRGIECWELGTLSALSAGALFAFVLRRGAWLSPLAQGASAGFLSGLVGLSVLEICCPYLDRAHRGLWHLGASVSAALLGIAVGALSNTLASNREKRS